MAVSWSIARALDDVLATDPGREALVTRSARLSYADLDAAANRAAQALVSCGVRPGDRVAASLPNDVDVVVAFHGAMRAGAVWLGINRALAVPEKQFQLDDTEAAVFICENAGGAGAGAGAGAGDVVGAWAVGGTTLSLGEWQSLVAGASDDAVGIEVDPLAPAGIAYTSGTTGRPKGVVHSQRGLLVPATVLVESRGYDSTLRKADCFPFTILNMTVLTTLLAARAGGTTILMDRIDAEGVAEWIRDEAATLWNGPPALLHSLASMDSVAASDLGSLREAWTGGADCPATILDAYEAKFGHRVLSTYGLTEAPTVVSIDPIEAAALDGKVGRVEGASGRPLPHLAVTIRDEAGDEVAAGETGEVCVGPAAGDDRYRLMLEYWRRPEATAETLAGGVLHTGDVGFFDEAGYLHLRDRKKLVIIRGGANVYPAEVERVLQEIDGVAASAVISVPDERLGERVVALVEVSAEIGDGFDGEAARAWCASQLAKYKVPERIVVIDSFPRNAMGKIVRTELPALLATSGE